MTPDYTGSGLVNLVAGIENRLVGTSFRPGLTGGYLPDTAGYVLLVLDGLGISQLDHPSALPLARFSKAALSAGFPTTTTTSLATVVTGLAPAAHGVIGHMLHLPDVADVVNVLKWVTPAGERVDHDYPAVLPAPNLWERLTAAGVEPITVQPGAFMGSPLSRLLYRGCRFEPAWTVEELLEATIAVARPGRMVMTYFPDIDVAAHVRGQESEAYQVALQKAALVWEGLAARLPEEVGLVATADHGHLDYRARDKVPIRDRRYDPLRFFGDPRSVYVSGPQDLIDDLSGETGADSVIADEIVDLLGSDPVHPELKDRLPDRLLLAPRGQVLLPRGFDKRLVGYHGGLEPEEIQVPLLVRG